MVQHRSVVAPGCHSNPLSTFSSTHKSDSNVKTSSDSPLLHNKEVPAYQVSGLDFIQNLQVTYFIIISFFNLSQSIDP